MQRDDGHPDAGDGPDFMYRAEWSIVPMPWDWPVEVNYHESRAFLNWKVVTLACRWVRSCSHVIFAGSARRGRVSNANGGGARSLENGSAIRD